MQRHKRFWKSEIILKIHFWKSGLSSLLHPRKKIELIAHKTGDCGKIFPEIIGNKNRQIVELFSGIKSFVLPKSGTHSYNFAAALILLPMESTCSLGARTFWRGGTWEESGCFQNGNNCHWRQDIQTRTILRMLLLHQIFFSDHEAIIHGGIILSRIFSTFKVAVWQIKRSLLVVAAIWIFPCSYSLYSVKSCANCDECVIVVGKEVLDNDWARFRRIILGFRYLGKHIGGNRKIRSTIPVCWTYQI